MCFAALGMIGPLISAIGSIAGAAVAAAGAQQQAQAQAQQAAYQAAVARNNAIAEAYKGSEKAQDVAIKGEYKLAQQRAAYGVSGAQVGTGSPVTVFGISSARIAGDVAAEQYSGKINAQRWQDQATLYDMQAQHAQEAGNIAATGALISGAFGGASAIAGAGGGWGSSLTAFG